MALLIVLLLAQVGVGLLGPRAEAATVYNWYLAEGYSGPGFQEYLCIGNPGKSPAAVTVAFLFNGATSQQLTCTVPALSRYTVDVNAVVGQGKEVSAKISSTRGDIAVERSQYFIYKGAYVGSHVVQAAKAASRNWYFAEGYTGPGFDEYACVLNPGSSQASLTFCFQTPGGEQVKCGSVPAHSRATFKVNDLLGDGVESSLELESDQPVVVERPTYFDYLGVAANHWEGGHCVMGATSLSSNYYFAEGTTRAGFEEWVTVQNANGYAINVSATYLFGPGQGAPVTKSYKIGAKSRYTVFVPSEVGKDKDVSLRLTSRNKFLAERPMYFSFAHAGLAFVGGNCSTGAAAPSSQQFLAEGYTGPYFEEWLCVQNPSNKASTVSVEYFTQEKGALPAKTVRVEGNTRSTILVNEHAGPDLSLASRITVQSGPGVVVERPIYVDAAGNPAKLVKPVDPVDPVPPPAPPVDPAINVLHGMCFSPFLTDWSVTIPEVSGLMDKIAPYTRWIRTFGSEGEWDAMPGLAKSKGLKIAAGADIWSDLNRNQQEVNQLIAQIRRGEVDLAVVGDEMLENNAVTEDQLIGYLRQVRATGALTSTSQTSYAWLQSPRVAAECDFITANIYPYWERVSIDQAIASLDSSYRRVKSMAGGKKSNRRNRLADGRPGQRQRGAERRQRRQVPARVHGLGKPQRG